MLKAKQKGSRGMLFVVTLIEQLLNSGHQYNILNTKKNPKGIQQWELRYCWMSLLRLHWLFTFPPPPVAPRGCLMAAGSWSAAAAGPRLGSAPFGVASSPWAPGQVEVVEAGKSLEDWSSCLGGSDCCWCQGKRHCCYCGSEPGTPLCDDGDTVWLLQPAAPGWGSWAGQKVYRPL